MGQSEWESPAAVGDCRGAGAGLMAEARRQEGLPSSPGESWWSEWWGRGDQVVGKRVGQGCSGEMATCKADRPAGASLGLGVGTHTSQSRKHGN